MTLTRVAPRWLRQLPRLHAVALGWQGGGRRRLLARTLLNAAGCSLLLAVPSAYARGHVTTALQTGAWLDHHTLLLAALAALAAALRVSQRRARYADEALRGWTAALPLTRGAARLQALLIETAPAARLAAFGGAALGGWRIAARMLADADPGLPWLASPLAALFGGILLGTGLSYVRAPSRPGETYEDSRYVPQRRRREPPVPRGSLAALGIWPVRQAFAHARPQSVTRLLLPLLVLMPGGMSADAAMLVLGLALALGALGSLAVAWLRVQALARRWVQPLPLTRATLTLSLLPRLVPALLGVAALALWLAGLLRSWTPPTR